MAEPRIRKQVYELTLTDFSEYPVWEFALDEETDPAQDEATVRPFNYTPPLKPDEGTFVVRARFTLADKTEMKGYLTPAYPPEDLGDTQYQPTIITSKGQVSFWYGINEPDADETARNYKWLGKGPEQVFPLEFTSEIEIEGGEIHGRMDGFYFRSLDSEQKRVIK